MKTINIDQTTKSCPECNFKPAQVETGLSNLIDHLKTVHGMGEPDLGVRHVPVVGHGMQECKTANFKIESFGQFDIASKFVR